MLFSVTSASSVPSDFDFELSFSPSLCASVVKKVFAAFTAICFGCGFAALASPARAIQERY